MDNMVRFAKKLKELRQSKGLSQAKLGEAIGVTSQTISAYENNDGGKGKTPTMDKMISLARELGVSLDYLCGLDEQQAKRPIQNLRDVAEILIELSEHVKCYSGTRERELTESEYIEVNVGNPDFIPETTGIKMAVFTIDNAYLADFIETKQAVNDLLARRVINENQYNSIIGGLLDELQKHGLKDHPFFWCPDDIDFDDE